MSSHESTSAQTSATADNASSNRKPDFLGLGGMRCGSTTLWEMLRVQPDVFLPEQKELHYFDNKDGLWDRGVEAYLEFFRGAEAEQVCGEITPEYLSVDYCTDRMRELVPDARLLVVLRDPVSRAWSHYRMSVGWGAESLPFAKAIRMEDERLDKAGRGPAGIEANVAYSYLERGRYVEHLQRLEKAFSREQLLVLMLPDFRSDRPGVMRRVREHLGLPTEPPGGELQRPPETTNALGPMCKNLKLNKLIYKMYPAARSGNTTLHKAARKALDATKRINTVREEPRPSEAADAWLRDYYAPFDNELEQWLGQPVPWRQK
ncbi:MAG: sulfotransferase [Planctomycetota bacterium]